MLESSKSGSAVKVEDKVYHDELLGSKTVVLNLPDAMTFMLE